MAAKVGTAAKVDGCAEGKGTVLDNWTYVDLHYTFVYHTPLTSIHADKSTQARVAKRRKGLEACPHGCKVQVRTVCLHVNLESRATYQRWLHLLLLTHCRHCGAVFGTRDVHLCPEVDLLARSQSKMPAEGVSQQP